MTTQNIYYLSTMLIDRSEVVVEATYHGICRKGAFLKLKVNGVKVRGYGTLVHNEIRSGRSHIAARCERLESNLLLDDGMFCRGANTKKIYWFYGQMTPVPVKTLATEDRALRDVFKPMALMAEVKPGPELENVAAAQSEPEPEPLLQSICRVICGSVNEANGSAQVEALPLLKCEAHACAEHEQVPAERLDVPAHKSVAARQVRFQQELVRVAQIRTTGLDPDVDMEFIRAYFPTSPATAYRKIKLGAFPKQIKRGSSSVWPFSVIEAYRLGQWVSSVDAGASGT